MKKKLFTLLAALLCGTLASFAQKEAKTLVETHPYIVSITDFPQKYLAMT